MKLFLNIYFSKVAQCVRPHTRAHVCVSLKLKTFPYILIVLVKSQLTHSHIKETTPYSHKEGVTSFRNPFTNLTTLFCCEFSKSSENTLLTLIFIDYYH